MDTRQKALKINLDPLYYGSFAEIGAGQEVARCFFQVGAAAGTVAKTISAYDMTVSDAVYGKTSNGRYVSRERLEKMLDHEFGQLQERLQHLSHERCLFAFCDTVAATSFKTKTKGQGWMGVRFFSHLGEKESSQVIVRLELKEVLNLHQQQTLGELGVNLLYACFYQRNSYEEFCQTLQEGLGPQRIGISLLNFSGPAFHSFDPRLVGLELVKNNLTPAVFFSENGELVGPQEVFYKKNIALLRGSFRPPTLVSVDMLEKGKKDFQKDLENGEILTVCEISMNKLKERGEVDNKDFLARVELLQALKYPTLISNFSNYWQLVEYLKELKIAKLGLILGVYNLLDIYQLEGGQGEELEEENLPILLEILGKTFGRGVIGYVYPGSLDNPEKLYTLSSLPCSEEIKLLSHYLQKKQILKDIISYNPDVTSIWSRTVLEMIKTKISGWEKMIPLEVVELIKEKSLFQ